MFPGALQAAVALGAHVSNRVDPGCGGHTRHRKPAWQSTTGPDEEYKAHLIECGEAVAMRSPLGLHDTALSGGAG